MPASTTQILSALKTICLHTSVGAAAGFTAGVVGGPMMGTVKEILSNSDFEVDKQISTAFMAAHNGSTYETMVAQHPEQNQSLNQELLNYQEYYLNQQGNQFTSLAYGTAFVLTAAGACCGLYSGINKASKNFWQGDDTLKKPNSNSQELKGLVIVSDQEQKLAPQNRY